MRASPDNVHFATASADRSVKIWNLNTKSRVAWAPRVHADQLWDVAYSPDGEELVSVADDGHVKFYSRAAHAEELAKEQVILGEREEALAAGRAGLTGRIYSWVGRRCVLDCISSGNPKRGIRPH